MFCRPIFLTKTESILGSADMVLIDSKWLDEKRAQLLSFIGFHFDRKFVVWEKRKTVAVEVSPWFHLCVNYLFLAT